MNRTIACIAIAFAAVITSASPVRADDAPPTAEQIEAAKKAFAEGKDLHDQGKLAEAADKFKESYRLSRNPLLLYNIGLTLDEAGQKDAALVYYRKFLSDAPPAAAQRNTVSERVKTIEKEKLDADLNGTTTTEPAKTGTSTTTTEPPKPPVKVKPAGTYSASDFQHQIVEEAPPHKPLDVTAFVPEDSGFTVTLYYRGSGDSKFTAKPMKWRYKELVGRIPASKVEGTFIQYYIEVKDQAGNKVTSSGKSTSPNLVNVDPSASPRFYPDITDDGEPVSPEVTKRHDEEDPLGGNKHDDDDEVHPEVPTTPGTGFRDVGSSKFEKAKWGSTITAGALVAGGVVFYILAKKQADNLVNDSTSCGTPPCRMYDHDYDQAWQDAGKRYQTLSNVSLGIGIAATAVAGYFWYRELTGKKNSEQKVGSKKSAPGSKWVVAPTIGTGSTGFIGAAAAARF